MVQFGSDNYSGICPEVLNAFIESNSGSARAYGDDEYTQKVSQKIREIFECECEVFFVFNGTAANSLSLASKMRFISAQWIGLLENDIWFKNAKNANKMAKYFSESIENIQGVHLAFPVDANEVFVKLSPEIEVELKRRGWIFHAFMGGSNRFVFSWDTQMKRVDELIKDIQDISKI